MDLYLLDSNYVKSKIIDEYKTLIWTVRYDTAGDFKLVCSPDLKGYLARGRRLYMSESDRIMVIDEVLDSISDEDGSRELTVSGSSLEMILDTRVIAPNRDDFTWTFRDKVGIIISRMVEWTCVEGMAKEPVDVIPEMYRHWDEDTAEVISVALKTGSLYERVQEVCRMAGLGFRIQLRTVSPRLRFNIYKGDTRKNAIFSTSLDTLTGTTRLLSQANYKNIAYVWADNFTRTVVAAPGTSINVTGTNRRVLYVDATDIDPLNLTLAEYDEELKKRGLLELSKHKKTDLFDGTVENNPLNGVAPARIGDIVYLMDDNSKQEQVRVSEFIWTHDAEGLRSFLTFSALEETP